MIEQVGAVWRKSSFSNANGECVEVADLSDGQRLVRDTKDSGQGPNLWFTNTEWQAFVAGVKNGQFD